MAELISHWKFDNDYVDDPGTNDLTEGGTGNSFSTSVKRVGTHSLQLNGSGYGKDTSISGLPTGNADMSFGGWVYIADPTSSSQVLISGGTLIAGQCVSIYSSSATTIHVDSFSVGWDLSFTVSTISPNTWYWWWVQYTASTKTFELFINNVSQGGQALPGNLNLTFGSIEIGGFFELDNLRLTGNIDDVRWYSGVTSEAERNAIYFEGFIFRVGSMLQMIK